MAFDPKARKIALNYSGGSLIATRGLLEAIFGEDLGGATGVGATVNVSVSGHSRQRIIGGPSTSVSATTYSRKKYPSSVSGGAAGGEPISLLVGSDWWTARLSGSHESFNDFLTGKTSAVKVWRSEKGTSYGPFGS